MKVEMRALDTIKPYEKNAKKHDQTQIDNVAEILLAGLMEQTSKKECFEKQ